MKKLMVVMIALALAMPCSAMAQKQKVNEYGEDDSADIVEVTTQSKAAPAKAAAPAKSSGIKEMNVAATKGAKGSPASTVPPQKNGKSAASAAYAPPSSQKPTAEGRAKRFQVGLVGPGFAYVSRGYGPALTFGLEGDYYFFERLSAGMRFEVETKFKSPTLISLVPHARYVFDFDRHPRFAAYAQAGVGVAIAAGDGSYVACDIAIPAGGFWWQWTDQWSVGAETSLHIYARSDVAVGWNIAPALRYTF